MSEGTNEAPENTPEASTSEGEEEKISFRDLKLSEELLEGLDAMGFQEPTPVQAKAIPPIRDGRDVIGCAQTGTGKTAAYLLPILDILHRDPEPRDRTKVLVIAPTRELAQQIDRELEGFSYFIPASSYPIYGGGDSSVWESQKQALKNGVDIVIGTPGRIWGHLNFDYFDVSNVRCLILDEADRMLDMGFYEDIMRIVDKIGPNTQNLLFSATMPKKIRELSKQILKEPAEIDIAVSKPAEGILQAAHMVENKDKPAFIAHLLKDKEEELTSILVFCGTKRAVDETSRKLKENGIEARAIHSDYDQSEREEVLRQFKNRNFKVLVATDVMSRGIDIKDIDLILNYDVPKDPEDYVHRIGRTARAEKEGIGITLINSDPKQQEAFQRIEKLIEKEIPKAPIPTSIGKSPEFRPPKKGKKGRGGPPRGKGKGDRKKKGKRG